MMQNPPWLFVGDPHGQLRSVVGQILRQPYRPPAVVLLGDMDLSETLDTTVEDLLDRDIPVLWIIGNHDTDGGPDTWKLLDRTHNPRTAAGGLDGRVLELGGIRIAGLGGIFRHQIWHPQANDGEAKYRRRDDYCRALPPPQRLPTLHNSTIWPEDFDRLADQQADVLVTHEAPSTHKYGHREIDLLAEAMGARLIVHGHQHDSYNADLPSGIRVIGTGRAEIVGVQLPIGGEALHRMARSASMSR